jgi:Matrixin
MRRSDPALALVACAIVLAVAAVAAPAHAYCRTSSCDLHPESWHVCTPSEPDDCGTPLFWAKPCVEWSLQKDASTQVTFAQAEQIVTAAFATWMSAPCPGGDTPRINLTEAEPAECHQIEYNQTAGNANIIMFRDNGWPYAPFEIALTTVTYNLDTGEIYDADMELNSTDFQFTTGDTGVVVDLASIVTHEMGHFLGLNHSPNTDATMFGNYERGTTTLRDLSDDDSAGICAIYPPGDVPSDCDPTPRHGFSALCAADQPRVTCGTAPAMTCIAAGKGGLRLTEKTAGKEKLEVTLTKLQPAVTQSQFGNPVTGRTAYAVCVYDAANELEATYTVARAQAICGDAPCWSDVFAQGYKYGDQSTAADGIRKMKLIGGDAGNGNVKVIGKNTNGNWPTGLAARLQDQSSATVQFLSSDASCFGVALTHVKKANGTAFSATGP